MTPEAFDNAIVLLMSLGGSTNAVIHLLALAGRSGVDLPLERFDEISRRTPMLTNIQPSGAYLVDKLFHAGGIPAVLKELAPLLHLEAQTVTGQTLGANIASATVLDRDAIGTLEKPWQAVGAIAILRGSLAPQGAVIKQTAAAPRLLRHEGRAVVFEDVDDLAARIDDPSLAVDASSVLVLRNAGPKGGPGMPEWGQLPIPSKLLRGGVTDMLRVSDARMSGTAFGTVVLHVAPESAAGGPLGVVRNGDRIILDVEQRRLDLAIAASELKARLDAYHPPPPKYRRGYGAMYLEHVLQADQGCDLDFLRKLPGEDFERDPLGIIGGPIGGW
jgi:dihydroxy-acid dehydratase